MNNKDRLDPFANWLKDPAKAMWPYFAVSPCVVVLHEGAGVGDGLQDDVHGYSSEEVPGVGVEASVSVTQFP